MRPLVPWLKALVERRQSLKTAVSVHLLSRERSEIEVFGQGDARCVAGCQSAQRGNEGQRLSEEANLLF
jgi:hypothetical protein